MSSASTLLSLPAAPAASRRAITATFASNASPLRPMAALRQRQQVVGLPQLRQQQRPSVRPCRSGEGDQQPASEQQQQQAEQQGAPAAPKQRPADPSVAKGQRTAIITGAISIIFGVIYLGLVSFLDMRGGELLPPPPEAYLP